MENITPVMQDTILPKINPPTPNLKAEGGRQKVEDSPSTSLINGGYIVVKSRYRNYTLSIDDRYFVFEDGVYRTNDPVEIAILKEYKGVSKYEIIEELVIPIEHCGDCKQLSNDVIVTQKSKASKGKQTKTNINYPVNPEVDICSAETTEQCFDFEENINYPVSQASHPFNLEGELSTNHEPQTTSHTTEETDQ